MATESASYSASTRNQAYSTEFDPMVNRAAFIVGCLIYNELIHLDARSQESMLQLGDCVVVVTNCLRALFTEQSLKFDYLTAVDVLPHNPLTKSE